MVEQPAKGEIPEGVLVPSGVITLPAKKPEQCDQGSEADRGLQTGELKRESKATPPPKRLPAGDKESPPTVEETRPCTTKVEQSPATTARRKRRVVVVGDSLLRGTEAPICRPDSSSREVCCLPGARIRDVTEALSRIIRPSDYYPMLLIHVGTNDTARCDTERIKCDYRALGVRVKEFGAQVVFSSILPVKGRGPGRERCILEVNTWLRRWCRQEGFGFLDHGVLFQEGLLGGDGVHLSRSGKALFGHRLANLVRRALN
ncbi:uncharacterized protein LOC142827220 [Pelodiscus sinensis]|uniref:uncharacterized protein LOC142827220 n=1 Tax=Pelodiscus sinensis TaxID=13735 RepID=UPI003F6B2C41